MEGTKRSYNIIESMDKFQCDNKNHSDEINICEDKMDEYLKQLNVIFEELTDLVAADFNDIAIVKNITPEWKFMCINFYCLHLLKEELETSALLCVNRIKLLEKCAKTMLDVGVTQNILKNLPFHKQLRKDNIGVKDKYYMLRASVIGLHYYTYSTSLKKYLFSVTFAPLLVGLLQLCFCPLKKPAEKNNEDGCFVMTNDYYDELICGQSHCREILYSTRQSLTSREFIFNLSLLMKPNNPRWFSNAIVSNLNFSLKKTHGIQSLFSLMEHFRTDECSTEPIVVVGRIVGSTASSEDFVSCIVPQIENLLYQGDSDKGQAFLFGEILKCTYNSNEEKGSIILNLLFNPLNKLLKNADHSNMDMQKISKGLRGSIKVISYVFINSVDKLSFELLKKYIGVLFNIYMFLEDDTMLLTADLQNILLGYFKEIDKTESFKLLENLIFNRQSTEYFMPLYNLLILSDRNNLKMNFDQKNIRYDALMSARCILSLYNGDSNLENTLFMFLLNCLVNSNKYFPDSSLLAMEDEGYLSTFEKKLAVYEILNVLASKDTVKRKFKENIPEELLDYFNQIFRKSIETGTHNNPEHDDCQTVFTIAVVLSEVLKGKIDNVECVELMNTVRLLCDTTNNNELKELLMEIRKEAEFDESPPVTCNEVEENIQFVLSNRIELQGHGLIALKKMIISKHPQAIEKKQFIFTIFKERLTHKDTYIYLAAINGVASFANLGTECTNMVLNTLCEEYREFPVEEFGPDATEMRLKIGEVLVKVSMKLGDMAPHYKALLLNTFLCSTKDEDHLVRASSLSNLGEICKILGYKLGSIVTEILVCVNDIINSDVHPEPRRAAIFVLRQLLIGLGKDMLTVLKDDILAVYRTLKFLYETDKDEVLRLQCQLAIEEVNTNMKEILTPRIEVHKPRMFLDRNEIKFR